MQAAKKKKNLFAWEIGQPHAACIVLQHTHIPWVPQLILEYIDCHQLLWKFLLIISLDLTTC